MSNNKYKILVIEDEANIRTFMETVLESNNYQMICAGSCGMGKTMFLSHTPDLVILDLGLPDEDGLMFLKFVRQDSSVPIIILSARTDEQDKVTALDMGANDYITKPFGTAELLARVRAALRNSQLSTQTDSMGQHFTLDDLEINYEQRCVTLAGENICLTQTEYNILAYLSEHAGKVLTYTAIIKSVWGYQDTGSTKRLQVNMANIRKKLGIKPGDNRYIVNELGVGYRMLISN